MPAIKVQGPRKLDSNGTEAHRLSMSYNQSLIQVQVLGNCTLVKSASSDRGFYVSRNFVTGSSIFILTMFILAMGYELKKKINKSRFQNVQTKTETKEISSGSENGLFISDRFLNNSYEKTCLNLSIQVFPKEDVRLVSQIGEGCFGKVFKGDLKGKVVAVKVFKKYSEEALKEVETMAGFSHRNILPLIGICQNSESEAPWILFEFMEHGDLNTVLRKTWNTVSSDQIQLLSGLTLLSGKLNQPQGKLGGNQHFHITNDYLMDFALQIAEGMSYLASNHFVHRDLAARNCLISANSVLKISDFGLSRDVYTSDYYRIGSDSKLLPLRWMSPESIMFARFTTESDMYAYGVLLWELFTMAKQPYYGFDNDEAMKMIINGSLLIPPSNCPNIICEIMAECWKAEQNDRPRFEQIVQKLMNANCGKDMDFPPVVLKNLTITEASRHESCYESPNTIAFKSEYMEVI